MYHIEVKIGADALKKLLGGKTVTVKNQGDYVITLVYSEANKKAFTKMKRNVKNMKGTRVNNEGLHDVLYSDEMDGEGILKSLKKGFQKVGKSFEKFGNSVEKAANKNAGKYAETAKKFIPKKLVQDVINTGIVAGATAIGQPGLALPAQKAANLGVNTLYKKDFTKKGGWDKAAKDGLIQSAVDEALGAVKNGIKPSAPASKVPTAVPVAIVEGYGIRSKKVKVKVALQGPSNTGGNVAVKKRGRPKKATGGSFKEITSGGSFLPIM